MAENPWDLLDEQLETEHDVEEEDIETIDPVVQQKPHRLRGVQPVDRADQLGRFDASDVSTLAWFVGVHGGSGASTVTGWSREGANSEHRWPEQSKDPVFLVARTNTKGLRAAQSALKDWASGEISVAVSGLILVADSPGKLPRILREEITRLSGLVPEILRVPWVEDLRVEIDADAVHPPKPITKLITRLQARTPENGDQRNA